VSGSAFNPVDVENKIDETRNRIAKGIDVVSSAEDHAKSQRRAFDVAFALAYLEAVGPIPERKYRAVLATEEKREVAELAETQFNHAKRTAESMDKELFAWQSISKSVVAMYGSVRA
jgi:hypothetical protein